MFKVPENSRVTVGPAKTSMRDGKNGIFIIKVDDEPIMCTVRDGNGWEIVVAQALNGREPSNKEVFEVHRRFWGPHDAVMELHPPETDGVTRDPATRILWRPKDGFVPLPVSWMWPRTEATIETEEST